MRLVELTVSSMEVSLLNDTSKYVRCLRDVTAERSGTNTNKNPEWLQSMTIISFSLNHLQLPPPPSFVVL